ncbi:MAG: nitroreductase [Burkholderiaceae bacterium]
MSSIDSELSAPQRAAFDWLLSRHSAWPLTAPAPSQAELDLIFDAALRAPDHGRLMPWRFAVIRDGARDALGRLFAAAAQAREPGSDGERFRQKAFGAPLVIALGVHIEPGHKVPDSEQQMAVAAAAMNMLNALHILGYGGFWSSGLNARDDRVKTALGFGEHERLIGFLYAGTPRPEQRRPERPARQRFVREWTGPAQP